MKMFSPGNNSIKLEGGTTEGLVTLSLEVIPKHKQNLKAYVISLDAGENRWNVPFTSAVRKALKFVKDDKEGCVLITRSSSAKFFSNGLDLANLDFKNKEFAESFGHEVMSSFADVLDLPIPTICLLQGHAFGAGMMFALAHDYRIQQTAKGFMCAPEIELGMPIPPPELVLFAHAVAPIDYFDTVLSAKRWDGAESYKRGLVHATGNEQEVMDALVALCNRVAHLGRNRVMMGKFKRDTKGHVADGLRFYKSKL